MPVPSRVGPLLAVGLALLTAVAGCGGGDQSLKPSAQSHGFSPGGSVTVAGTKVRDCKVSVTLTGAVSQDLEGMGRAIYDNPTGPQAFYQFTSGDTSVQVYSDGKNFTASVVITTKSGSFTSDAGTKGLRVSTSGRSASVDADTIGLDENSDGVHVQATYTCA